MGDTWTKPRGGGGGEGGGFGWGGVEVWGKNAKTVIEQQ